MGKNIPKTVVLIISVIIIAILITGSKAIRLHFVLKEKKELETQLDKVLKQNTALENNLSKLNLELKAQKDKLKPLEEELLQIKKSLEDKTLQETENKEKARELKSKVELILTPQGQENKE